MRGGKVLIGMHRILLTLHKTHELKKVFSDFFAPAAPQLIVGKNVFKRIGGFFKIGGDNFILVKSSLKRAILPDTLLFGALKIFRAPQKVLFDRLHELFYKVLLAFDLIGKM